MARVQEPTPVTVARVLHGTGVELLQRDERPTPRVPVHIEERMDEVGCLKVVDVSVF